jgi:predicted phosphoribosyltransferase
MALFENRLDAGKKLAAQLTQYAGQKDVIVLALPRGGVPVAYEVARAIDAPMDVFLVRKLGVPGQEELAFGAIASGGIEVVNPEIVHAVHLSESTIRSVISREREELRRREQEYRDNRPEPELTGKTVILIDDGLATGASMYAAVVAVKQKRPRKVVVAIPVASPESCSALSRFIDQIVCAYTPEPFYGVGQWYEDFSQTSDEEVRQLLELVNQHIHQSSEEFR